MWHKAKSEEIEQRVEVCRAYTLDDLTKCYGNYLSASNRWDLEGLKVAIGTETGRRATVAAAATAVAAAQAAAQAAIAAAVAVPVPEDMEP